MMIVERLQVEEGFLDGLDLEFVSGLNVIIGPRGSGKTSIVQLIRFCLNVPHVASLDEEGFNHALSILGGGQVTVTLFDGNERVRVSRTAAEDSPRRSRQYESPLIFSQNEIEKVGRSPKARLSILDEFDHVRTHSHEKERSLQTKIRSLSVEIASVNKDLFEVEESIAELQDIPQKLQESKKAQDELLGSIKAAEKDKKLLELLDEKVASLGQRSSVLNQVQAQYEEWARRVKVAKEFDPHVPPWPNRDDEEDNPLDHIRDRIDSLHQRINTILEEMRETGTWVKQRALEIQEERLKVESKARSVRKRLEGVQAGAGAVAHRMTRLKEKQAQLKGLQERKKSLNEKKKSMVKERGELLDDLESLRLERHESRQHVAQMLNELLSPAVEVHVSHGGYSPQYQQSIKNALKGSGLHYNILAPQLAASLSPRELVELLEMGNIEQFAEIAGISVSRAEKVASEIVRSGTADILTAPIQDAVDMKLLDGAQYRTVEDLSTGQRCTVVLSVLMSRKNQVLIIDQPEDNLDNAFIVETLVRALHGQKMESQFIFTTHNANIPVLGEADKVILMSSDGQKGFCQHSGPLKEPKSVEAITTVMEGGREAFQRRARFYEKYPNDA